MRLTDAVTLIKSDLLHTTGKTVWADLGCGSGLFTYALGSLLHPGSTIFAIDKKPAIQYSVLSNSVLINPVEADFEKYNFHFGKCDGMLMANSIHYVKDKIGFINRLKNHLQEHACFLVVEYDTDEPVQKWVPYPLSFSSLTQLCENAGYHTIHKIGEHPSIYGNGNIYAAVISK